LVPEGQTWDEVVTLAKAVAAAGASILNTGIGWHEARVPTIATSVPRRAFAWVTKKLMGEVTIPVITSNRINTPEVAEAVLAEGCAEDRKSTRLNSSHVKISYAVFCLKKKKQDLRCR